MDECIDDMTPPLPTNVADFVKHLDRTVFLKSGKWVAKIRHPIRNVWVCLGIYSNYEEAADAYTRKKLEYESHSVQETTTSFHSNVADFEQHPGVKRMASGKWAANIKHNKVNVCLGSYNSPNEAAGAFDLSKLELQSPKVGSLTNVVGSVDLELQCVGSSFLQDGITQAVSCPCAAGRGTVYQEKSGKWKAQIQIRKVRHKLGTYSTAEDAQEALNQKKYELGLKAEEPLDRKKCELGLRVDPEQSERDQRRSHAYVTKTGRWKTEIGHPITKAKRIYLGTFDTAEEAEDAYDSTRRQFELMFPGYMNRKQSNKRVHFGNLTEDAEEVYNNKMREVDMMVSAHKKPKKSKGSSEADAFLEDESDAPDHENCKLDSGFGLKGEDAQEAVNRKKCELGLNGDAEQSERKQRRRHAYTHKSGRWRTEIRHPITKAKKIHLGSFETAEEAEDAYNSIRRQFELKFPGYMNRKQSNKRVQFGTLTEEAEEAYNNKMHEVDLIVRAHKKPKKSKGGSEADAIMEDAPDHEKCKPDLGFGLMEIRSMDECIDDMTLPSPTNGADIVKHLDSTVFLKSGKWVAKIRHPIRKVWVCVGIYNNHEEAADAFTRKKLEYESHSVQETASSFNTNVAVLEKHPGVKRRSSGKWGATIKHKKVNVWLGSYNTFNEAADAYDMSKLELQSPKLRSLTKASGSVDLDSLFEAAEAPDHENCKLDISFVSSFLLDGITQAVRCPCAEDAEKALDQKKCELGLKAVDAEEALDRKKCELGLKVDPEQSERNQGQRHAYLTKAGRWKTEIGHPITKAKRIYLGTFDTAEEAEEAYSNIRRQFELMFPGYMNRKQSNKRVQLGNLNEDAEEAYNDKMHEVDLMVSAHKKPKKSKGSSEADAIVVDESDAPDHENCKLDSGFGLKGEDAQEAVNQKKCELVLKGEDAEEAVNRKKAELGLTGHAEQSERKQRRRHAYVHKSGRWRTEIMHPMKKCKKISLGSFETAEEAENAYNSIRREFESMFPAYMKRRPSNKRVHLGILTEEAEEAYNNKMSEVDLIVRAHKKPKKSKGSCKSDDPFICSIGSSVIKGGKEEDAGGSNINVNVESVLGFVKEETGEFDLGVIDSCGQFVGEFSRMDDELLIGCSEDDANT